MKERTGQPERAKVREISGRVPCKGSKKRKYVKAGQIKQERIIRTEKSGLNLIKNLKKKTPETAAPSSGAPAPSPHPFRTQISLHAAQSFQFPRSVVT